MGIGDQILATGLSRGAHARGKRVAFGDGRRIIWNNYAAEVFRNNPNIAWLGSERDPDIEWVPYYKGHRIYNTHDHANGRWIWHPDRFKPAPGELYFDEAELAFGTSVKPGFVLIEPNVPWDKSVARNKDWGGDKYQAVADALSAKGYRVAQFSHGKRRLTGNIEVINAPSFRHAFAALQHAALYIGPEGGTHHAAAAVGVPGVVLFGGFVPPSVTGYDLHTNLTGGVEACGSLNDCAHCMAAMDAISVDEVIDAAVDRARPD